MEFFGYTIGKTKPESEEKLDTFAPPLENDGAIELAEYDVDYVSNTKYVFDFETHFDNEEKRINEYRRVSLFVEADYAITDIVNESVVQDQFDDAISIDLDGTEWSESIKKKIIEEWKTISRLYNLNREISTMFRQWYVDGKIYYHKIVDSSKPQDGIKEVRYLDPRRIKKVREVQKSDTVEGDRIVGAKEYYLYSLRPIAKDNTIGGQMGSDYSYSSYGSNTTNAMEISPDMIAYAHSGLIIDEDIVLSYLQKALKPLNQLNLIEDSIVIYRLSRAPERRIFYIDVGNLNKTRAEQYIKSLIGKYRNKFVYDSSSGSVKTSKQNLSMMEDIWLPRKEGSRGTEVSTLEGGQNLGELEDLNYFKQKSFRALNVPLSRLDGESTFNIGRSSEITRDEVRFSKFADKLRNHFSEIFYDTLRTQLLLKRIITEEDWEEQNDSIKLIYNKDSYYDELKDQEVLQARIEILQSIDDFVGKYYSVEWVRKRVLMQDEEEIKEIDDQNEEWEKEHGDESEEDSYGGGSFDGTSDEPDSAPEPQAPIPVVVQEPDEAKKEEPKKDKE